MYIFLLVPEDLQGLDLSSIDIGSWRWAVEEKEVASHLKSSRAAVRDARATNVVDKTHGQKTCSLTWKSMTPTS